MCGLFASIRARGSLDPNVLARAIKVLEHRGPDAVHTWLSADGQVGLAHTRLSIIDLSTGDQPISNEDGSIRAVVNGEFYDFAKIRQRLEQRGHQFKTRSDSEILVHLYEEYGANCLEHLRGEFAFVLWDARSQRLFAARDRFGIKPLYYTMQDGDLHFASEIKSFRALGINLSWDKEAFFSANILGSHPSDRTLYQGIFQVPPAHKVISSKQHFRLIPYWDFNYPTQEALQHETLDNKTQIEQFGQVLEEAVRLRLQADVPVAAYLSGGLDSCAVLGLAARQASQPLHAFTLGFDHDDYDETRIAQNMAKHVGAHFHPIFITQTELADNFQKALTHAETLFVNAHGVAKFLLSKQVRDAGFKVVLTGEGSDEILAGYPHFRQDKILYQMPHNSEADKSSQLRKLSDANKVSSAILMPHEDAKGSPLIEANLGFFPTWMSAFKSSRSRYLSLYRDGLEGLDEAAYQNFIDLMDVPGQLKQREPVTQSMYLWSKMVLPNYILTVLGDRMEMAHSIEGRVPFLDHHVVGCAAQLPLSLKIHNMTEKYVLREAVKPYITEEVYARQKHPFLSPPATLKNGPLHQLLRDTIASASFKDQPFFEQEKVLHFMDELEEKDDAAKSAGDVILTAVLSTALLQDTLKLGSL